MLSPRRCAQLGLSAASLTLVASITVLIAGAAEPGQTAKAAAPVASSHVSTLASSQFGTLQADLSQQIASAKH